MEAASVSAQTLTVTSGGAEQVTKMAALDTSISVSGNGILVPGAINQRVDQPLTSLMGAQLSVSDSGGGARSVSGSLADFKGLVPEVITRHTAGEGLRNAHGVNGAPSSLVVSTSVPSITGLALRQEITNSLTIDYSTLTVFP